MKTCSYCSTHCNDTARLCYQCGNKLLGDTPDVNLKDYDIILLNTSAGKDSQAMTDFMVERARKEGVLDRVTSVHADLGRVEWTGTPDIAQEHANHYRIPLEVISRPQGDLLQHIGDRGMFPSPKCRYCTSDHKRTQIGKIITKFVARLFRGRKLKVLNCLGLRADESTARAKKNPLAVSSENGRRVVHNYLPIHKWSIAQVWERIRKSGVRPHYAYSHGMPRVSCVFCIFANKDALVIAGQHNPELLNDYVKTEKKIGHKFRQNLSLAEVQKTVEKGDIPKTARDWTM